MGEKRRLELITLSVFHYLLISLIFVRLARQESKILKSKQRFLESRQNLWPLNCWHLWRLLNNVHRIIRSQSGSLRLKRWTSCEVATPAGPHGEVIYRDAVLRLTSRGQQHSSNDDVTECSQIRDWIRCLMENHFDFIDTQHVSEGAETTEDIMGWLDSEKGVCVCVCVCVCVWPDRGQQCLLQSSLRCQICIDLFSLMTQPQSFRLANTTCPLWSLCLPGAWWLTLCLCRQQVKYTGDCFFSLLPF